MLHALQRTKHQIPSSVLRNGLARTEVFNVTEDLVKLCDSSDVNKYGFSVALEPHFSFIASRKLSVDLIVSVTVFCCLDLTHSDGSPTLRIVHISNGKVVQVLRPKRSNLGIAKAVYLCMYVCVCDTKCHLNRQTIYLISTYRIFLTLANVFWGFTK